MQVTIKISPVIYSDEYLNRASQRIGAIERKIFGDTKQQLFENIKRKIWAMSSEAVILDSESITKEYNAWIAAQYHTHTIPKEINNLGQQSMYFALPYSKTFKDWLRKNN